MGSRVRKLGYGRKKRDVLHGIPPMDDWFSFVSAWRRITPESRVSTHSPPSQQSPNSTTKSQHQVKNQDLPDCQRNPNHAVSKFRPTRAWWRRAQREMTLQLASHLLMMMGPMESRLRDSPPWCNETLTLGDGLGFERVDLIGDTKGTRFLHPESTSLTSLYPAIYFIFQRLFQRSCSTSK